MAEPLRGGKRYPCIEDVEEYGRDWTRPDIPVYEQLYMIGLCDGCPAKSACLDAALDEGDLADGIWGGLMWRSGRNSNPRPDAPEKRSTMPGVHWESKRGQWKAYGHTPRDRHGNRRFVHIGYFDKEDDAIEAVKEWRENAA